MKEQNLLEENEVKDLHKTIKTFYPTLYEVFSKRGMLDKQPFSFDILLLYYQQKLIELNDKKILFETQYREEEKSRFQSVQMTKEKANIIKEKVIKDNEGSFCDYQKVYKDFDVIKGLVIDDIVVGDDYITFVTKDNKVFNMYHEQDCCESVYIDDVCGDWDDIIGTPITLAEEVESDGWPDNTKIEHVEDSYTWTFYKIGTIKGVVTIRWYGTSNGYYSESVDFCQCFHDEHDESFMESDEYKQIENDIASIATKISSLRSLNKHRDMIDSLSILMFNNGRAKETD